MPDPISTQLPDPQASVDAALGTLPVPETPPAQTASTAGDETPLAFAAPMLNTLPTPPSVTATPIPTTPSPVPPLPTTEPSLEPATNTVGSSYLPPVPPAPAPNPVVEASPKPKSKMMFVMIGVFALLGAIGAMGYFAYNGYMSSNSEVAVVGGVINCTAEGGTCVANSQTCANVLSNTNCGSGKKCAIGTCTGTGSMCTPNTSRVCDLIDGCAASQKCNGSGTGWGNCQKNDPNCAPGNPGTGGSGGTCAPPGTNCENGVCVNLTSNVNNCGACGNSCTTRYGAAFSVCENSVCKSATDAQCRAVGQEPCDAPPEATMGIGHTCCAPGYTCSSGVGCIPKTSTPKPTTNPSTPPSAPPVVTPTLACTGLTQTPATTPVIGQTLTFTCAGSITPAGTSPLTYKFRYSLDDGADQLMTNKTATTAELTINACGTYSVQCKVCATIAGVLTCDPTWTGAVQ